MDGVRLVLLFLPLLLCVIPAKAAPKPSLRLVNLVYRHGDRSPELTYPKNPHLVNETWPQGLGWLTEQGIQQQYALGRYLRRRYDGFLNATYLNSEIYVDSSDTDRCLMSAYANLAGLYPPNGTQLWNKNILWQPIPVHTRPNDEDNMLNLGAYCAKYEKLYNESLKSPRILKEELENKDFYNFITEKTGVSHESIDNIWKIADTLYCEKQNNVSWPQWVNSTIYKKLRDLDAMSFDLLFHGKEEARLKGGPLLGEWNFLAVQRTKNATGSMKMNMYSAHDSTIAAVMSALKVFNMRSPPYTSTVIMELHENATGVFHVELFFRNVTTTSTEDDTEPYPLVIPGCVFECPLTQFLELTKDMIPMNWDQECSLGGGSKQLEFNLATTIAVSISAGVILILIIVIAVMCRKRRRDGGFGYRMTI